MNFHSTTAMFTPVPVGDISAQTIAKSSTWTPRRRAKFAALWCSGHLTVKPTIKLAAVTFHVSVPLVADALKGIEPAPQESVLVAAFRRASPAERAAAARIIGIDQIWDGMIAPAIA
jgi:hypothetical protein